MALLRMVSGIFPSSSMHLRPGPCASGPGPLAESPNSEFKALLEKIPEISPEGAQRTHFQALLTDAH